MHVSARCVAALILVGCATPGATTRPEPAEPTPPAEPAAKPVEPPVAAEPGPVADAPAPVIDPAQLSGYVWSREASQGIPASFTARVAAVEHGSGGWRFTFEDAAAKSHQLKVTAADSLPAPLRVDDRVQASVRVTGGGPNMRYALLFTAEDGALLLAVNEAPAGWKVVLGALAEVDRGSDYVERTYGVAFEHAGVRVAVAAGDWARMQVGAATYHVWGSGARRKLRPGKRAMPDYVESWLDFAVVRVR